MYSDFSNCFIFTKCSPILYFSQSWLACLSHYLLISSTIQPGFPKMGGLNLKRERESDESYESHDEKRTRMEAERKIIVAVDL